MKKIKSSTHQIVNLNLGSKNALNDFLCAYKNAVAFYVDHLRNNRIQISEDWVFDLKNDALHCPSFISTVGIEFETPLSARALKCAASQACGLVKAAVDKRRRLLFKKQCLISQGQRVRRINKLIAKTTPIKPNVNNIKCELNSLCFKIETSSIKHFDTIITLQSIGKSFGKILIPINHHRHSRRLAQNSTLKNSVLISQSSVDLRWEYEPKA